MSETATPTPTTKVYLHPHFCLTGTTLNAVVQGYKGDFDLFPYYVLAGEALGQALAAPEPVDIRFIQAPANAWALLSS